MPHLDAAYNLARWLTKSPADADDVVQEAFLRAFKYFDGFAGDNAQAWLLSIVRNSCFTWMKRNRPEGESLALDAIDQDSLPPLEPAAGAFIVHERDPETRLAQSREASALNALVEALPAEYREIVVLREFEDLSYREIGEVVGIPIGTVMSRLSRARALLQQAWRKQEEVR